MGALFCNKTDDNYDACYQCVIEYAIDYLKCLFDISKLSTIIAVYYDEPTPLKMGEVKQTIFQIRLQVFT